MRFAPLWLPLVLVLSTAVADAIERLPIEDFAREPETSRATLSPDGKHLAFLRDVFGRTKLHVLTIANGDLIRVDPGEAQLANGARKDIFDVRWVGDDRLIISTSVWDLFYGVLAMNIDGGHARAISGLEDEQLLMSSAQRIYAREVVHRFFDRDQNILMLDRHEDGPGGANRPDVLKIGTKDGQMSVVLKNPGEVAAWGVDGSGTVRVGILSHGDLSGVIYRENERAPWRTILPLRDRRGSIRPAGFDSASDRIFVAALTPAKRWTVFPLDPATGQMGQPLLADPEYDILPERYIPDIDGMPLCAPVFSSNKDVLLGMRYVADAPRVKWFDPEYAAYQKAVDRALPDTVNLLVETSRSGRQMLWFGYSDQNPGVYLILDLDRKLLKPVASRMSWIKPAQMAQMLSVKYTARDGLVIHGFLTVPPGHEPKHLPLVVVPHGGPWVRDVWGFDPLIQLLANRGYAVLQMDYRGSTGYGQELLLNAKREIGGKIQDDIEDGARWAIASGVADPHRIAIYGMSYGGYSALFALGHNPTLYRCGISFAGVTDWLAFFEDSDVADYRTARRHWREQLGDPSKDVELLKRVSPVTFAANITAPLLIIQGTKDQRVPQDQAKRMIAALMRQGRTPEALFVSDVAHNYGTGRKRLEIFTAIVGFLERNLGPGVE